ncbi:MULTISPECIES: hypothetical protein [unclassified Pseudoalteromonas]|uniref:hypothetical protein n=1 Tax=unclassified Pseudoalteromonas TaxID=194690 RepID=UPI001109A148|nr:MULTISPECIES: hypothetical protein [unclassified Pseudoalteromonas]MBW4967685.1 hypothetical protein [Pseudoalteromonas sp. CR1]TMN82810.1 hypothetical protein CWB64_08955 [Pseudoalteromonas sp. S410]TMN92613.1 hypothetical protein CWB62_02565 [Pseudoalteromonas sp. S408]TMN97595.1 hypothetical protein CWB63_13915 [Pseudoalteromonas sp. S409]TMO00938.1 hypothetical protein CWB61_01210 [Pseudoalteromonas sp. S407]
MTNKANLPLSAQLLKHILLWTVFGYCYQSGLSVLIKMAADAQPDHPLITAFVYGVGFNIIVAHLITKYDTKWPVIASIFIGVVGLIAVPIILGGTSSLLTSPLLVGFLCSLVLSCFIVGLLKVKLDKN